MNRPKVFLSFAGDDLPTANVLAEDLRRQGVEVWDYTRDVPLGGNFVLAVNQEMASSDYCVLLWSRHCVNRRWVEAEYTAALDLELSERAGRINERRSFLFVVRLDGTRLPPLLAVRRYLDGSGDLSAVARGLAAAWDADLEAGTPVFPPPDPPRPAESSGIAVLVRNRTLGESGVTHVVVAPDSTGDRLLSAVRAALALPDSESQFNGMLELRFSYRLLRGGVPVSGGPLAAQGITDDVILDLEVHFQARGPDGPFGEKVYRRPAGAPPRVPDKAVRALIHTAFEHLLP